MEINRKKTVHLGKENNYEHFNKKESESLNKIDRLLMMKRMNHEDKEAKQVKQLRFIRNSKELRVTSKSFQEKIIKNELKPINDQLSSTQQYCILYGNSIIEHSEANKYILGSFLNKHDVDKHLRARMLDWMIEVTSSYKFSAKTYFSSVYLMDKYFQAEDTRLPITKLHIIGVISMLIATKMDEVYPLKVKTVYEKIVHKKIEKKDLVQMQARIVNKLDFSLNIWSFYDYAILKLHDSCQLKNQEILREIEQLCEYIGKFVVFNYELFNHYDNSTLSESVLRASFKVYGQEKVKLLLGQKPVADRQLNKDSIICMDLIFQTIKTFKTTFKSVSNIYKFTEPACLEQMDNYLKHY